MSLADVRRRLAKLEGAPAVATRFFVVIDSPPDAAFFGFWCAPLQNVDYREHLDPDEYFEVHGTDRDACEARAHQMAAERWLEHPTLVVVLKPITEPPTRGTTQ